MRLLLLLLLLVCHSLAAVARRVYLRGGLGIGAFRRSFGGNDRRGSRPGRHTFASGGVIRNVLQQLEAIKVLEKNPKGYVL
jgi:small subunit ribosomal protein S19e